MDEIEIRTYEMAKKNFDFDNTYVFCNNHRVEVIMQDDLQFHCFIDYPKNPLAFAIDIHPIAALVKGITIFKEAKFNK